MDILYSVNTPAVCGSQGVRERALCTKVLFSLSPFITSQSFPPVSNGICLQLKVIKMLKTPL